jgi:hypothetical protein
MPVSSRRTYGTAIATTITAPALPHGAPRREAAPATTAPKAAAVAVAPTAWSARAPTHLVRVPYTTGLMVSTIESPQGPHRADQPATADAPARARIAASVSTTS